MPRDFCFGLVRVPMYDYYWGLTAAQVELLTIDQPIVVYKKDTEAAKNEKKPWENGTATAEYAQQQYARWKARQEAEKKKGVKVDLGTFLTTGEKKPVE